MPIDERGHPDAGRLGEYADGVLPAERRSEMEAHLADCPACRAVVADTVLLNAASQSGTERSIDRSVRPFRPSRQVTGVAAALAAAALVVVAVWIARPLRPGGSATDRPELQQLIAALAGEPTRPVEGRLTGGFKYAPPPSPSRGSRDRQVSPDVRIAAARIEKIARDQPSPEHDAASGTAFVAVHDWDRAVAALESAVARRPSQSHWSSDLAAAYLGRAVADGKSDDFGRALDAANRALNLEPTLTEALFNRALALQRLGRADESRDAWRRFLRREADPDWTREAERIGSESHPPPTVR